MSGAFDGRSMLAEVKKNRSLLDSCALHSFTETEVHLGQKLTCRKCGGQMHLTDIGNYIRGYQSAGKLASDIWPAWKR